MNERLNINTNTMEKFIGLYPKYYKIVTLAIPDNTHKPEPAFYMTQININNFVKKYYLQTFEFSDRPGYIYFNIPLNSLWKFYSDSLPSR